MSKTKFEDGRTVITAEFLNKMYGGDPDSNVQEEREGHVHDGLSEDGHAGKIDLNLHVKGTLDGQRIKDNSVDYSSIKAFDTADLGIPVSITDSDGTRYLINPNTLAAGDNDEIQYNSSGALDSHQDFRYVRYGESGSELILKGDFKITSPDFTINPVYSKISVSIDQAGDISYTLPTEINNDGYLQVNSSGELEWATVTGGGSSPFGPVNTFQYNGGSGSFSSDEGFYIEPNEGYGSKIVISSTGTNSTILKTIGGGIILENESFSSNKIVTSSAQSNNRILTLPSNAGAANLSLNIESFSSGTGDYGEDEYVLRWGNVVSEALAPLPSGSIVTVSDTQGEKQLKSLDGFTVNLSDSTVNLEVGDSANNGSINVYGDFSLFKAGSEIKNTLATASGQSVSLFYNLPPSSGSRGQYLQISDTANGQYTLGWDSVSSGAPTDAEYLVLSANATLSNEKVFSVDTAFLSFTTGPSSYNLSLSSDVVVAGNNISILNNDEGFLKNVVEDTSPQLGGNLDAQNNSITNVSALSYNNSSPMELNVSGASLDFNSQIGSGTNVCDYNFGGEGSKPASINLAAGSGVGVGYFNIQAKNGSTAEQVVKLPGSTPSSTGQVLSVSSLANSNKQIELAWTTPSSGGAPTDSEYIVLSLDPTLTNEKVLGVEPNDLVMSTATNSLTLSLHSDIMRSGDNVSLLNNDSGFITSTLAADLNSGGNDINVGTGNITFASDGLDKIYSDGNAIRFVVDNGNELALSTASLYPMTNGGLNLGSTTANYSNAYIQDLQLCHSTASRITISPPTLSASYSLVLPADDGDSGQFLQTDGLGNLTWATASGSSDNLGDHTATQTLQMSNNDIQMGTGFVRFAADGQEYVRSNGSVLDFAVGGVIRYKMSSSALYSSLPNMSLGTSSYGFDVYANDLILRHDATNNITISAPTLSASYSLVLPVNDGNNGEFLQTDGLGNLTWASASGAGISNVVEDISPQLGGALDANGNNINMGTSKITFAADNAEAIGSDGARIIFNVNSAAELNLATTALYPEVNDGLDLGSSTKTFNNVYASNLKLHDGSSNTITLTAPSIGTDYTLTLPTTDGAANQILQTDGSGTLSWVNQSSGSGSSTMSTQTLDDGSSSYVNGATFEFHMDLSENSDKLYLINTNSASVTTWNFKIDDYAYSDGHHFTIHNEGSANNIAISTDPKGGATDSGYENVYNFTYTLPPGESIKLVMVTASEGAVTRLRIVKAARFH